MVIEVGNFERADRRGAQRRRGDRRGSPVLELRPSFAEVSNESLRANLRVVRAKVGESCRVLAVVKADGYGHGAVEVARHFEDEGAWGLAVSLVEEGVELRLGGLRAPVLVLGGVHPGSEDVVVHRSLTPVVWEAKHLGLLRAAVRRAGAPAIAVHLKIDTGMSRLGVLPKDLPAFLDQLQSEGGDALVLEGVMTHLARADEDDDEANAATREQLEAFESCLGVIRARGFRPRLRHVCNSAGVQRYPEAHYDMVRPGIALFGAASSQDVLVDGLSETMSLHSKILGIRELPAGTSISYGHRFTLERDARIAIVPVGYADGYMRNMSGRAEVLVRGHRCRVVGNITMDLCMVDVSVLPDAREGESVTLIGKQGRDRISVFELSRWAEVLPYEILCGISKRVPRR
jgi:alanine racemase